MRKFFGMPVIAALILMVGSVALADWDLGDPHKMHYAQTPKPGGMDVEFAGSVLADDWRCTQTGPVADIHFWVSWVDCSVQTIPFVNVQIFSDVPDLDGTGPLYSTPGQQLWQRTFQANEFTVRDMTPDLQSWFNPSKAWPENYYADNHRIWQQINIDYILDPFKQERDQIYWLAIDLGTLPCVGWKESGADHFNDDAVWWNPQLNEWIELRHPDPTQNYSIDLAFVITPEPATLMLLTLGALFARKQFN